MLTAADRAETAAWLATRQRHFSLPAGLLTSQAAFRADAEVFANTWVFVGSAGELREPGAFFTLKLFDTPIIVLRDRDGELRAFHNICRHRGALLCEAAQGKAALLACGYHHWSYGLDGRLITARTMPDTFRKDDFPLRPIALSHVEGMLFVCLADTPPDPAPFAQAVGPYIAPHGGGTRTKVAHQSRIVERGNWKLVIENNRECYHCPGNHPEFLGASFGTLTGDDPAASEEFRQVFDDRSAAWAACGAPYLPADGGVDFRCIRMPLRRGFVSFTIDGGPASARVLGDLTERDMGSLRLFRPPNCWNHYLGDHIIHFRVLPLTPDTSELQTTWLVHEDAVEGVDYDVDRLTHVWRLTNDQDRALVEKNQAGIASRGYQPGPQSAEEVMVDDFQTWYARELAKVLA